MKKAILGLLIGALISPVAIANPYSVMEKLVKREGLEGIKVVYANYETEKFFEEDTDWGSRASWGGIENPFDGGEMLLVNFLETFFLLVPEGGANGVVCRNIYEAGTLITYKNSTIQTCTVNYGIFELDMIVDSYAIGNAVEDAEISSFAPVGLRYTGN